jgi:hypothetical protein
LKTLLTEFFFPGTQRIVTRALALPRRTGSTNDFLVLNGFEISGEELQIEWRARDNSPRSRQLSDSRQTELFADQALQDTDAVIARLFRRLAKINRIKLQVLKPEAFSGVIIAGQVDRVRTLIPDPQPTLTTKLRMMGVHFRMRTDHLALLPEKSWGPMVKHKPQPVLDQESLHHEASTC